jgi:hypothetical protein
MAENLPREITELLSGNCPPVCYGSGIPLAMLEKIIPLIYTLNYVRNLTYDGFEAYFERVDPDGMRYFEQLYEAYAVEPNIGESATHVIARGLSLERYREAKISGRQPILRRERAGNLWHLFGWFAARGLPPWNVISARQCHVRIKDVPFIEEYVACWGIYPDVMLPQDRQVLVLVRSDPEGMMRLMSSSFVHQSQVLLVRDL